MVTTYTKGIQLPLMRPLPLPIPVKVNWWQFWEKAKSLSVRAKPRKWLIEEDYVLDIPWINEKICIPYGFIFDGASVPRVLWPFMAPTGIMFIAGLFHDFGYRYNCYVDINYKPIHVNAGRAFFDSEIEKMGTWINDATVTPNVCWAGLKVGGWCAWNKRRKEGHDISVDFPEKL